MDAVPIVDAAVIYDDPYTRKKYLLIARNALHVPSMQHHLVPPFVLREAGLIVNKTPKCQRRAGPRARLRQAKARPAL